MITATHQGLVTLSANPLCHQQVVFITVKGSRSSVLACQGFQLAFCVEFIPLLLTAALIAAWGTMTQTCTHAAAYWPTTLSVENQSRNKKQREREGGERGKERCLLVGQGLKRLPPPPQLPFLWHLSDLMQGNMGFVYVALYWAYQSIPLCFLSAILTE